MVDERPDLLSLTEMYKVAASYEKGSADYDKVMRTAARLYPDSPAVVNDRALEAIAAGKHAASTAATASRSARVAVRMIVSIFMPPFRPAAAHRAPPLCGSSAGRGAASFR